MRFLRVPAVAAAAVVAFGCAGGNILGANPADGGCGFRPEGLVAADLVGTWQGPGDVRFTLHGDGTYVNTPGTPASAAPSRPPAPPSRGFGLPRPSSGGTPGSSRGPGAVTGSWTLLPETRGGDLTLTADPPATGTGTLYASGTRAAPWLYTFGEGDPDSCDLVRYDRTAG